MDAKKLDAKISIPVLYLESDYEIMGRALVVPIQGTGLFTANLSKSIKNIRMINEIFNAGVIVIKDVLLKVYAEKYG